MSRLGFIFAIFVATTASLADSRVPAAAARQEPAMLGPGDVLGPSYPNGTQYVRLTITMYELLFALGALGNVFGDFDDCDPIAAEKGAQLYIDNMREYGCGVATLKYPLCRNSSGPITVFVIESFITDGDETDGAVINSFNGLASFPHGFVSSTDVFAFFRIENPTVLQFPQIFISSNGLTNDFTVVVREDGSAEYIPLAIVADPACHTNSSCATPFLVFTDDVQPPHAILQDYCGQTITIPAGEELNILSHPRIGCELFPNSVNECRVNFAGTGLLVLKITYTNFVQSGSCNGFYLGVDNGVGTAVNLCTSPSPMISAPSGSGEIVLSGTAATATPKYGFIINIS